MNQQLTRINVQEFGSIEQYKGFIIASGNKSDSELFVKNLLLSCAGQTVVISPTYACRKLPADFHIIPELDKEVLGIVQSSENPGSLEVPVNMVQAMSATRQLFIFDPGADPNKTWNELTAVASEDPTIESSLLQALFSLENEMKRRQVILDQCELLEIPVSFPALDVVITDAIELATNLKNQEVIIRKMPASSKTEFHPDVFSPYDFWQRFIETAFLSWDRLNMRLTLISNHSNANYIGLDNVYKIKERVRSVIIGNMAVDLLEDLLGTKASKQDQEFQTFTALVTDNSSKHIPVLLNGKPRELSLAADSASKLMTV